MTRALDIIAMMTRLVLAGLIGGWIVRHELDEGVSRVTDAPGTLPFVDTVLLILLVICASWLVLGIRSRVVALISTTLVLVQGALMQGTVLAVPAPEAMAMVLLTVVMLVEGGGRLALYRRGWHEVL